MGYCLIAVRGHKSRPQLPMLIANMISNRFHQFILIYRLRRRIQCNTFISIFHLNVRVLLILWFLILTEFSFSFPLYKLVFRKTITIMTIIRLKWKWDGSPIVTLRFDAPPHLLIARNRRNTKKPHWPEAIAIYAIQPMHDFLNRCMKMVFVHGRSVEENKKFMKECNEMHFYHHSLDY